MCGLLVVLTLSFCWSGCSPCKKSIGIFRSRCGIQLTFCSIPAVQSLYVWYLIGAAMVLGLHENGYVQLTTGQGAHEPFLVAADWLMVQHPYLTLSFHSRPPHNENVIAASPL